MEEEEEKSERYEFDELNCKAQWNTSERQQSGPTTEYKKGRRLMNHTFMLKNSPGFDNSFQQFNGKNQAHSEVASAQKERDPMLSQTRRDYRLPALGSQTIEPSYSVGCTNSY